MPQVLKILIFTKHQKHHIHLKSKKIRKVLSHIQNNKQTPSLEVLDLSLF